MLGRPLPPRRGNCAAPCRGLRACAWRARLAGPCLAGRPRPRLAGGAAQLTMARISSATWPMAARTQSLGSSRRCDSCLPVMGDTSLFCLHVSGGGHTGGGRGFRSTAGRAGSGGVGARSGRPTPPGGAAWRPRRSAEGWRCGVPVQPVCDHFLLISDAVSCHNCSRAGRWAGRVLVCWCVVWYARVCLGGGALGAGGRLGRQARSRMRRLAQRRAAPAPNAPGLQLAAQASKPATVGCGAGRAHLDG